MRKTTIELTEEQYFFLKEKALELQKQNQPVCRDSGTGRNASIASIIRDLVERDREEWMKDKKGIKGAKAR